MSNRDRRKINRKSIKSKHSEVTVANLVKV
jgi:hypothetical protein